MADGAERGYDVDTILHRRRGGRPPLGSAAASVESVRLDPELKRALMIRSGVDARPVVLALVEDTISSLASLLLAASIAAAQQGRLHVAHISSPRVWWGGTAGMPVPADMLAEADRAAAGQFRERVGGVLALGAQVEWTFTWTRGMVHHTVTRLVSELLPTAVMLSAPRRQRVSVRRRWPGG